MANVSILNTTSQLSGKTLAVCENDQTISGAWTFTGNQLFNGNITLGNAVGDTITVTGTLTSNLIFTDATYDIGASGATRPRDLFLSRNATIGGTLGVTGAATLSSTLSVTGAITATAGQIVFPATQAASADANTLDDYEEGTWTPTLGGTTTYANQDGVYTKVGRLVHIQGHLNITLIGTGSATVVSGLPFTSAVAAPGSVGYFDDIGTSVTWLGCKANAAATTLQFVGLAAAGAQTTDPVTVFQNGTDVYFSVTYSV